MPVTPDESHQIAVHAGQGDTIQLSALVRQLAEREGTSPAQILLSCKDDFHQTAAHIASKAGQTRTRPHQHLHVVTSARSLPL
jgi:hypothetical protein